MYSRRIALIVFILICHFHCPSFAINSIDKLNTAEEYVLEEIKKGKIADLKKLSESNRILSADFIIKLMTGALLDSNITKSGILIDGARIKDKITLLNEEILLPVTFLFCSFDEDADFSETTFHKNVNFVGSKFYGKVAFFQVKFSGEVNFSQVVFSREANFYEAVFSEKVDFHKTKFIKLAHFADAKFLRRVSFSQAEFYGEVSFLQAVFSEEVTFYVAKFSGNAFFRNIKFFKKAYFYGSEFCEEVDFSEAEFSGHAIFSRSKFSMVAVFSMVNFSGKTYFTDAKFYETVDCSFAKFLDEAYFPNVIFAGEANFSEAKFSGGGIFSGVKFSKNTDFSAADLKNTHFSAANLSYAIFKESDLNNCRFWNVKGFPQIYEPKAGSPPYIPSIASLPNLSKLTFENSPHGLVDLREGFKKLGYREQERKVTYALRHTLNRKRLKSDDPWERLEGRMQLYLFEKTCKWGIAPGQPLRILIYLMVGLSFIYMFGVIGLSKKDGIWKVWMKERLRKDLGADEPEEPLKCKKAVQIWGYGFYFSLLSAFHIGWRELNVGSWIARIQPREYTLRATGWVRVLSGIQSLISVYLLALSVLTYFGRPFDQF